MDTNAASRIFGLGQGEGEAWWWLGVSLATIKATGKERAMRSTRELSQALQQTEIVDGLDSPLLGVLRDVLPPGVKSNLTVEGDWKHLTPRTRDQIYLMLRMGGSGLRFMEERAEMVGGGCRVYSGSGTTGTRVEVRVPLAVVCWAELFGLEPLEISL